MLPERCSGELGQSCSEYGGSGQSVMEMSHRSKWFDAIITDYRSHPLRRVMNIPVIIRSAFSDGATQRVRHGAAELHDHRQGRLHRHRQLLQSGCKRRKVHDEGHRIVASSKDKNFTYIPDVNAINYDKDASYIHICQNNFHLRLVCRGASEWRVCRWWRI